MNSENVVSVAHCQQQPFCPLCTFTSLSALLWMLSFRKPHVCLASERADTWETDPKASALEEGLCLGFTTKLFAPDVHWSKAEGDEKVLCKRTLE